MMENDQLIEKICGLVQFHRDLLDILIEFNKICKKHNIQYSTGFGTMLGQIRHQGFIPWDDDADICMTRENYDRFLSVANSDLKSPLRLLTSFSYDGKFVDLIPKISKEQSRYKTKKDFNSSPLLEYPHVDLFVLDKAPKNKLLFKLFNLRLKIIYGLCAAKSNTQFKQIKISLINRIGFNVVRFFGRFFRLNYLLKHYDKVASKYRNKKKFVYCASTGMLGLYRRYDPMHFVSTIDLPFKDITLSCYSGYEAILKQIYGDYKTPVFNDKKYISHFEINGFNQEELNKYYR